MAVPNGILPAVEKSIVSRTDVYESSVVVDLLSLLLFDGGNPFKDGEKENVGTLGS